MKIILANKYYYPRGGDCVYTINLAGLLEKKGHEVAVFAMQYPDNLPTRWDHYFPSEVNFSLGTKAFESILRPFGTREVREKFLLLIKEFQPDVVHVNNVHSQLSPVIIEIAHQHNIKVVWTLHDYKLLCPRYDCLRNGCEVCEECFSQKKSVLIYSCMKNSKIASWLAYLEAKRWHRLKLESFTDTFICPSRFMATKMEQGGFNPSKLVTLPNFTDATISNQKSDSKADYYCYVGRLTHEKGIKTLIDVARQLPFPLKVLGDGPLKEELQNRARRANIDFMGHKKWDDIQQIVANARFTVAPSEWYENCPLSIIESLCAGTPVLGARIGGIPELITENKNGWFFEPGNAEDLKQKINEAFTADINYDEVARSALQKYSVENYYNRLIKIYKS